MSKLFFYKKKQTFEIKSYGIETEPSMSLNWIIIDQGKTEREREREEIVSLMLISQDGMLMWW